MQQKFAIGAALAGAFALGATFVAFSNAQSGGATSFNEKQEAEIKEIVRQYLIDNPEVMIESLNAHMERERVQADAQAKLAARDHLAALSDPAAAYVTGKNPDAAKITVVEMFDYHCGFCKKATPYVRQLASKEDDVKFVFREFPILRQESDEAAQFALAARNQGKYQDLHFALMESTGTLTKDRVKAIAEGLGIDFAALEKDAKSEAIEASLDEAHRIAAAMGVSGTPTFVIATTDGDFVEVVEGFSEARLKQAIADARKAAKR